MLKKWNEIVNVENFCFSLLCLLLAEVIEAVLRGLEPREWDVKKSMDTICDDTAFNGK